MRIMELTALKAELSDPTYDGMSVQDIADTINTKTVQRARLTPTWEVKRHAILNGYWAAIIMAAEPSDTTPDEVRGLAISARDWIDDPSGKISTINLSLSEVQTMIGALVATTLMTQEQATSLLALGTETVSWTEANGLPEIGIGLIHSARIS